MTHPSERSATLAKRATVDLDRAVVNGASKKRAKRHRDINKRNSVQSNTQNNNSSAQSQPQVQSQPESTGYIIDNQFFKQGGILKASGGLELNPSVVVAERQPNARFYLPTSKPALPALPERKLYLEPKSSKFAEYNAVNNKESDEVKNAREYISKLVDSDDYKKLSLTNPEIARTILSTQIEGVLANTKDENVRNQISKELESFRQTSLFKKGGIIKAKDGVSDQLGQHPSDRGK